MNNINSSKIWTIIKHEYLSKVKTKSFIILTLIAPVLMLSVIAIPMLVTYLSIDSTSKKIAVIDNTTSKIGIKIVKSDESKYFLAHESVDSLRSLILRKELDGYILLSDDAIKSGKITVYTKGGGGFGFLASLEKNIGSVVRTERLVAAGAEPKVISLVKEGVDITTEKITEKGTQKDDTEISAGIGYIFGFLIYIMMLMYGSFVMKGVIEEKTNRIVEIIASSAKPFEIMFGKVIGIGSVGLTQVLFWVILSSIIFALSGSIAGLFMKPDIIAQGMQAQAQQQAANFQMPHISVWLVIGFIFYFLSGYFIYATLFAAVGSAVDQESDAQQLMWPVMTPIIIPILFISNVISNPDGTLAVVLSMIPFFTPILMIVRVSATEVPLWQIVSSTILLILTFLGCLWVAARIYRVGILMNGKKPSIKDVIKWLKVAN